MSGKYVPLLRHTGTGIPVPFWDTRIVPRQTMLEYLGIDLGKFDELFAKGLLTPVGGFVETGEKRPVISYIPAVVWASNKWTPTEAVLRVLALSAPDLAIEIAAARRTWDEVARLFSTRPAA